MYNLMVSGIENSWEEGAYSWSKSRIFEYTDDAIRDRFAALSTDDLTTLASYRTLFMYERGVAGPIRVGKIKHVRQNGAQVRIIYEFDTTVPTITFDNIEAWRNDLDIEVGEFTRHHWAVKNAALFEILARNGLGMEAAREALPRRTAENEEPVVLRGGRVFIVHGRERGAADQVARFLETKAGLNVCILQEQANRGRTLITKFQEESADAIFSVVLMTGDDVGNLRPELADNTAVTPLRRARQNVIFELGFFLGKLGHEKVCALISPGVEKPSDYDGVVYISYDEQDGWKHKLVNELQAANIEVAHDWWRNDPRN